MALKVCGVVCCAIALGLLVMFYYYGHYVKPKTRTTFDSEMYAAIVVVSSTCPYCVQQLEILKQGGQQARERVKVLDTERDRDEITRIIGDYEAVPLWFDPITRKKNTGVKSLDQLKQKQILF